MTAARIVRFPVERRQAPQLVTLRELQERYGFSDRWWAYRRTEGLPCHKWGARMRFDPAEVEAWLEDRYAGTKVGGQR